MIMVLILISCAIIGCSCFLPFDKEDKYIQDKTKAILVTVCIHFKPKDMVQIKFETNFEPVFSDLISLFYINYYLAPS